MKFTFNTNIVRALIGGVIILLIGVLIYAFVTKEDIFGPLPFTEAYSNDLDTPKDSLYKDHLVEINNLPSITANIRLPVYQFTSADLDIQKIVTNEKLTKQTIIDQKNGLIAYSTEDNTNVLQVTKSVDNKFVLYLNGKSQFGDIPCVNTVPEFFNSIFGLNKDQLTVDLQTTSINDCVLKIYQKAGTQKIVTETYQPLCEVSVSNSQLKGLKCNLTTYTPTVSKTYQALSLADSYKAVISQGLSYGFISTYDLSCNTLECPDLISLNKGILPKEIKITDNDVVYVPVKKDKLSYLLPFHRIQMSGNIEEYVTTVQKVTFPAYYTVIIPALQFRYFQK